MSAYHRCWTSQNSCVRCNRFPSNFGVIMLTTFIHPYIHPSSRRGLSLSGTLAKAISISRDVCYSLSRSQSNMFQLTIFWVAIVRVTIGTIRPSIYTSMFFSPIWHLNSSWKKSRTNSNCQIFWDLYFLVTSEYFHSHD